MSTAKTISIAAGVLVVSMALGATTSTSAKKIVAPAGTYTTYCPAPADLVSDPEKMTWGTKSGFKSFQQSFVVKMKTFLGAQWEGVNIGQIICIYHGANPQTFPVQVLFDILTLTPSQGKWIAKKGHYSNCVSNNPKDCPFFVREKPKKQNLNKIVQGLQSQPVTNPYQNQEP